MRTALWTFTAVVLAWSLLTGGATSVGFPADVFGQILALPLLLWGLATWWSLTNADAVAQSGATTSGAVSHWLPFPCLIAAGVIAFQLLPIGLNSAQSMLVPPAELGLGTDPLLPAHWSIVSVTPEATMLAGLSMLAPLAIFVAVGTMNREQRRTLAVIVIAVGLLSLFLGILQLAQGERSPLRFYTITNPTEAVGLFANRNHFAAQLYVILALGAAWLAANSSSIMSDARANSRGSLQLVGYIGIFALVVAGLVASRSRAGTALMLVALLGVALLVTFGNGKSQSNTSKPAGTRLALFALLGILVFVLVFGAQRIFSRSNTDILEDLRWIYAGTTFTAFWDSLPFGAGLGSFVPVYAILEKPTDTIASYANRAHNDLAEFILETGVIGIVVIVLFLVWFFRRTISVWSAAPNGANLDQSLQKAATIAIGLILLHSLVDYPLRTTAHAVMFAFACALLLPAPPVPRRASLPMVPHPRRGKSNAPAVDTRLPEVFVPTAPSAPWQGGNVAWPEAWDTPGTGDKR